MSTADLDTQPLSSKTMSQPRSHPSPSHRHVRLVDCKTSFSIPTILLMFLLLLCFSTFVEAFAASCSRSSSTRCKSYNLAVCFAFQDVGRSDSVTFESLIFGRQLLTDIIRERMDFASPGRASFFYVDQHSVSVDYFNNSGNPLPIHACDRLLKAHIGQRKSFSFPTHCVIVLLSSYPIPDSDASIVRQMVAGCSLSRST